MHTVVITLQNNTLHCLVCVVLESSMALNLRNMFCVCMISEVDAILIDSHCQYSINLHSPLFLEMLPRMDGGVTL